GEPRLTERPRADPGRTEPAARHCSSEGTELLPRQVRSHPGTPVSRRVVGVRGPCRRRGPDHRLAAWPGPARRPRQRPLPPPRPPRSARRGRGSRRTALVWRLPGGTAAAGALTGVRIARQIPTGESPASVIGRIAPAPVLVVHGTKDPFFPVEEARDLYERAGEPKALWVISGGGHAEGLFTEPGRPVAPGPVDGFAEEPLGRPAALGGPARFR